MKKCWLTSGALASLAAAAAIVSSAAANDTDFPVRREHRASHVLRPLGSRVGLDLRSFNGSIEVTADDGGDVRLDVTTEIAAESAAGADAAERDVRLELGDEDALASTVVYDNRGRYCGDNRVNDDRRWQEPRYRVSHRIAVRVPRGARVQVCTVNTRAVVVAGPVGAFDIRNVNGRIEIRGALGSGRATTVNGPVTATLAAGLTLPSVFQTVNGDVTVTVPEPFSADLRMKTFNGELLTDFDVESLPVRAEAATESRNGRFVFRSNQYTTVRAGRGGPDVTLETLDGDVRVLRASR